MQRCPKQCITMREDKEGFLYPEAAATVCINCGLCEKVCPVINKGEPHRPIKTYAAKNPNEVVRRASSSGGIFSLLAERTIEDGGVVFGARFDENWEVEHGYTETTEGIAAFRGSKYVQSRIGESYKQAETFLKQGREVLFSGTPCQVAGLRHFLRKDYENLVLVDFICHGVPSPAVFRSYLDELKAGFAREGKEFDFSSFSKFSLAKWSCTHGGDDARVEAISFRDKRLGWKRYSFSITLSKVSSAGEKETISRSHCFLEDDFMQAFLSNIILRPSCYACKCKGGRSGSDIMLGDFWGIENVMTDLDDYKGISLVMVNKPISNKVVNIFDTLGAELNKGFDYDDVLRFNPSMVNSVKMPLSRKYFFSKFRNKKFHKALQAVSLLEICDKIYRKLFFSNV